MVTSTDTDGGEQFTEVLEGGRMPFSMKERRRGLHFRKRDLHSKEGQQEGKGEERVFNEQCKEGQQKGKREYHVERAMYRMDNTLHTNWRRGLTSKTGGSMFYVIFEPSFFKPA